MELVTAVEKAAAAASSSSSCQTRRSCNTIARPSWLAVTLADMEERVKALALNMAEEDEGDTFAERAECYYGKRPQLLSLLQDLYNAYLSLADRYIHHHHPRHGRHSSQVSSVTDHDDLINGGEECDGDSEAESSLSYQQPPPSYPAVTGGSAHDAVVAELVMKSVDYDIMVNEMRMAMVEGESWKKIELQRSLLEVLESERLILLQENARLGYMVKAVSEENRGLADESAFMKRKAAELARCILKMREDYGVRLLTRRIEDLQGQIYGLEKRNKDYYQQLQQLMTEEKKKKKKKKKNKKKKEVGILDKLKWWDRLKNFDMLLCGAQLDSTP